MALRSDGLKWFRQPDYSIWIAGKKSATMATISGADLLCEIKVRKAAMRFGTFSPRETARLQKQLNELTLEAARRELPELESI